MKKRFTVMLDEKTIKRIKDLNYSPIGLRELIEYTLNVMVDAERDYLTQYDK